MRFHPLLSPALLGAAVLLATGARAQATELRITIADAGAPGQVYAKLFADRFDYGAGVFAEEHIFVPRADAAEGGGWLVGTSLDTNSGRTRLAVFEAMRLADGPVALATLPYAVPLGLHGTWAPG